MTEAEKTLEDFRHHYFKIYGKRLDDDLLYIIIRINELQKDLKNDIAKSEKLTFRNRWDYFAYGFGKYFLLSFSLIILAISIFVFIRSIYHS